jgi:hypothetical protein
MNNYKLTTKINDQISTLWGSIAGCELCSNFKSLRIVLILYSISTIEVQKALYKTTIYYG